MALSTKRDFSYYGNQDQAELAMQTAKRAMTSQEMGYTQYLCSDEYRRNRRTTNRTIIRKSFHEGFFDRLNVRYDKMIDEREAAMIHATGTNLVVLTDENLRNEFTSDTGINLRVVKGLQAKEVDRAAYQAGDNKGKEFVIIENNMIE